MQLSEIFEQLSYGELAQLNLAGADGAIAPENYAKLLAHINMGLTELHKRFLLKEGELTIPVVGGTYVYPLAAADVIKIERVYALVDGEYQELELNNNTDAFLLPAYSVRTPDYKTLIISTTLVTTELKVVYRATHLQLVKEVGYFNPKSVVVSLPYSHLEALLYYVASRLMNPIGMSQQFHDGNNFAAKFEQSCMQLENQNLKVDQSTCNTRLERNGWV